MRLVISGPKFLNIIFQISVGKKMLLIYRSKPLNAEISSCFKHLLVHFSRISEIYLLCVLFICGL